MLFARVGQIQLPDAETFDDALVSQAISTSGERRIPGRRSDIADLKGGIGSFEGSTPDRWVAIAVRGIDERATVERPARWAHNLAAFGEYSLGVTPGGRGQPDFIRKSELVIANEEEL